MMIYLQSIETGEQRSKFQRIYTEYLNLMLHTAYQILGHQQDAEDAVHQAFLSIAKHIRTIKEPCPMTKSYVLTITEHKAIDMLRKRQRHRECTLSEETAGIEMHYDGDNNLAACILKLPAMQRQIIWLKYYHGYNLREIAQMLDISHAAAIKLDQRAKAKLKALYYEQEEGSVQS